MTDLNTEEKKDFLQIVKVDIIDVCMYNRYDIPDKLADDLANRIFDSNNYCQTGMILDALKNCFDAKTDFFTPRALLNFVNERVRNIYQAYKKKKDLEMLNTPLVVELTPEQEAERLKKKAELEALLKPIEEKTTTFKGFRRPFEKDEDFEKWKLTLNK